MLIRHRKQNYSTDLINPAVAWRTDDILHRVLVSLVESPGHDGVHSERGDEHHHHPVEDSSGGEESHEHEPEPEEDVDLLVDDVEGEDAETIVFVDGS